MSLRIGLDFDGVFSDCETLKDDVARDIHDRPYTTLKDADKRTVRNAAYGDRDYALKMEPIEDAFKYVTQLHEKGYDITIITSRDGDMLNIAQEWFADQREQQPYDVPDLPFNGVGYHNEKRDACLEADVDVFVDDDLHKLEPLVDDVQHRFHFVGRYAETDPDVAEPVEHWAELYDKIQQLSQ